MSEQTAIMVDVRAGRFDYIKGLAVAFSMALDDFGSMADGVMTSEQAYQALLDAKVDYVSALEGKPCIVDRTGNIIKYIRMWKGRNR